MSKFELKYINDRNNKTDNTYGNINDNDNCSFDDGNESNGHYNKVFRKYKYNEIKNVIMMRFLGDTAESLIAMMEVETNLIEITRKII